MTQIWILAQKKKLSPAFCEYFAIISIRKEAINKIQIDSRSRNDALSSDKNFLFYESKFILDSFIFHVSPARFLRWLAAIVAFSPRSRVFDVKLEFIEGRADI